MNDKIYKAVWLQLRRDALAEMNVNYIESVERILQRAGIDTDPCPSNQDVSYPILKRLRPLAEFFKESFI